MKVSNCFFFKSRLRSCLRSYSLSAMSMHTNGRRPNRRCNEPYTEAFSPLFPSSRPFLLLPCFSFLCLLASLVMACFLIRSFVLYLFSPRSSLSLLLVPALIYVGVRKAKTFFGRPRSCHLGCHEMSRRWEGKLGAKARSPSVACLVLLSFIILYNCVGPAEVWRHGCIWDYFLLVGHWGRDRVVHLEISCC